MDGESEERTVLRGLLSDADAVLLDFDGPVTDLFRGVSTAPVATEIKDVVRKIWGRLDPDVEKCDDSHGILRRLRDMYDSPVAPPLDPRALYEAEAVVTRQEYEAVREAEPAPDVVRLVNTLSDRGLRLLIVSNNADGPIWEFLKRWGIQSKFDTVVGRDPHELRRMKPDPYSVLSALRILGVPGLRTLLIGDQLTDLQAARGAGPRVLGHTPSAERAREMRDQGADWVVRSHVPVIRAALTLESVTATK
jgi:phosphoglycolate phosphatase-like HAD superfamily hydrolase